MSLRRISESACRPSVSISKIHHVGSTVAQWLALLPHSKKVQRVQYPAGEVVWGLHVLPVFAWVSSYHQKHVG